MGLLSQVSLDDTPFFSVATWGLLTVTMYFTLSEAQLVLTKQLQLVTYIIGQTIYRIYFHPLAKIPGPTLNAISVVRLPFTVGVVARVTKIVRFRSLSACGEAPIYTK